MKSREEYQASIFAKRDALLRKRKKHISQAVAGIGAAVCLASALIIIPQLPFNLQSDITVTEQSTTNADSLNMSESQYLSDFENHPEDENAVKTHEDALPEMTDSAAEAVCEGTTENMTYCVPFPVTKKTHPNIQQTDIDSAEAVDEMITQPVTSNNILPESMGELHVGAMHSHEEIADAAFSHLSMIQKARCVNKNNPEAIPVTSAAESVYLVTFNTDNGESYQVVLRQDTLELVEIRALAEGKTQNSNEEITFRDGYKGDSQ